MGPILQVLRFLIQTASSFHTLTARPTLTKHMNPLKEENKVLQRVLPQKQNKTGFCFGWVFFFKIGWYFWWDISFPKKVGWCLRTTTTTIIIIITTTTATPFLADQNIDIRQRPSLLLHCVCTWVTMIILRQHPHHYSCNTLESVENKIQFHGFCSTQP